MAAARPNRRNATAMGKRIAEHVMMRAGETSRLDAVQALSREQVAQEGLVDRVEQGLRVEMARTAAEAGQALVGLRKVSYAVVAEPPADEEPPAEDAAWTGARPGIQDIPLKSGLLVRLTGFGVPVLEVP